MNVEKIRALLREIEAEITGTMDAPVAPVPEGMIAVRPTGPQGAGKVRYYPDPLSFGRGTTPQGLNLWGYYTLVTGENVGPYTFSAVGHLAGDFATYPEAVDRILHGADWTTQDEINMAAKLAERDRGSGFSPR